jgi:hypothetical protein
MAPNTPEDTEREAQQSDPHAAAQIFIFEPGPSSSNHDEVSPWSISPEQCISMILNARAADMTVRVELALPYGHQGHAFASGQAQPRREARPSSTRDLGISGYQAARWLSEMHIGGPEDLSEARPYNPAPNPSQRSTSTPTYTPSKKNLAKYARKKAKKSLSRLRTEEELDAAGEPNAHADAQSPLPELLPSFSNESTPFSPPKSPQTVYERSLQHDASDAGKRSGPVQAQWQAIETTASPPLESWEEEDEIQVNGLDASAIAQPPSLDSPPSPSDKLAASPPPSSLEDTNGMQDDSDASVFAQPDLLEIAPSTSSEAAAFSPPRVLEELEETDETQDSFDASVVAHTHLPALAPPFSADTAVDPSPLAPEEEEEEGLTTASRQRTHAPEANPPLWVIRHVDAYHTAQVEFQSAFAASPVSQQSSRRFKRKFQWCEDTQQRQAKTNRIVLAARIACHASWTRESKGKLMHPLWQTIYHRERAASWYALLDPTDSRIPQQAGHAHFLDVLREAWEILNNGVKFDQRSPPGGVT